MGFMDELKKLTKPYDDSEDFFDDAEIDTDLRSPVSSAGPKITEASQEDGTGAEPAHRKAGGFLSSLGHKKSRGRGSPEEQTVNFRGMDTRVIIFNPQRVEEAGELVGYLREGHSVVMSLEDMPIERARRVLDFISGVCYALQAPMTPVAARAYYIAPSNTQIIQGQEQPQVDEGFF